MTASQETAASVPAPPAWARRPANLARAVTAELVERIVRGVHPPGTPLPPEPALCETFSVSRTVVREAVKILQEKGLVQVRQGTGTMVTPPAMWNMLDELVLAATIAEDESLAILDDLVVTRRLLESDMANVAARLAGPGHHRSAARAGGSDGRARGRPRHVRRARPRLPRHDHAGVRATASPAASYGRWRARSSTPPGTWAGPSGPCAWRPTSATAASTSASPRTTPTAPPRRCSRTSPRPGSSAAADRATPYACSASADSAQPGRGVRRLYSNSMNLPGSARWACL